MDSLLSTDPFKALDSICFVLRKESMSLPNDDWSSSWSANSTLLNCAIACYGRTTENAKLLTSESITNSHPSLTWSRTASSKSQLSHSCSDRRCTVDVPSRASARGSTPWCSLPNSLLPCLFRLDLFLPFTPVLGIFGVLQGILP